MASQPGDQRPMRIKGRKKSAAQHCRELAEQGIKLSRAAVGQYLHRDMPEDDPARIEWLREHTTKAKDAITDKEGPVTTGSNRSDLESLILVQKLRIVTAKADREEQARDKERGKLVETEAVLDIILGYTRDAQSQISKIPNTLKGHFSDIAQQVTVANAATEVCVQTIKTIVQSISDVGESLGLNIAMENDGIRGRRRGGKKLDPKTEAAAGAQVS